MTNKTIRRMKTDPNKGAKSTKKKIRTLPVPMPTYPLESREQLQCPGLSTAIPA